MSPQPYIGLCVIFRDNVDTLPTLLKSVDGHFDFFSFTDTGAKDGSRELIDDFLKTRKGKVSEFVWVDDFAAARQVSFDACPARWKMFLDTDDCLVNPERVRMQLLDLEARVPQVEALFIPYEYGHLERLPTMRICRWRDGWKWTDAIHERLEFVGGLPDDSFGQTEEFYVQHKDKTPEDKERALRRNARIAEREYARTKDPKYRSRLARTIAMEMKMDGKAVEAIPLFEELYNFYPTYPEGRQAASDIARSYQYLAEVLDKPNAAKHLETAMVWAKRAGPAYEGLIYFSMKNWEEVLRCCARSAGRGQQATHEGFIFEKGAIYVAAAASVLEMKKEGYADVADHLLSQIPPILRNDPSIGGHVNSIRLDVDRITILVPGTPQPFDENGGGGMLGGSEEAVLYLSRTLAQMGRNVRIYAPLPPHRLPGPDKYGVDWQQAQSFDPAREHGTLILWRAPNILLKFLQGTGPLPGVNQAFLWLHDSGMGLPKQAAQAISGGCDGAVILSDFHASMIRAAGYEGNLFKLANGVVDADFEPFIEKKDFGRKRDQNKVIYSSCPSRGLVQLLEMWPKIKASVPDATLDIYYDWSMLEAMQPHKHEQVVQLYRAVEHLGVKHHGGVSHERLHNALRGANVWAYSHFESPQVETFCISSVKALACGATVLTVPNGALPEVVGTDGYFMKDVDSYCKQLIELLRNPESVQYRRAKAKRALKRFGWNSVARSFSKLWSIKERARGSALDDRAAAATVAT